MTASIAATCRGVAGRRTCGVMLVGLTSTAGAGPCRRAWQPANSRRLGAVDARSDERGLSGWMSARADASRWRATARSSDAQAMARTVVLITGCSSGIGYDAAQGLRARGWRVFATCRQEADCERLRGEGLRELPPLTMRDERQCRGGGGRGAGGHGRAAGRAFQQRCLCLPGRRWRICRAGRCGRFSRSTCSAITT